MDVPVTYYWASSGDLTSRAERKWASDMDRGSTSGLAGRTGLVHQVRIHRV